MHDGRWEAVATRRVGNVDRRWYISTYIRGVYRGTGTEKIGDKISSNSWRVLLTL